MYSKMMKFTYRNPPAQGGEFTTVANFAGVTEQDLKLQIDNHIGHYGVIAAREIEPEHLGFEDLADD